MEKRASHGYYSRRLVNTVLEPTQYLPDKALIIISISMVIVTYLGLLISLFITMQRKREGTLF